MEASKIREIFLKNNLAKVDSIKKIEIGFTNKIYSINDKFILKVCEDKDNEGHFEKEVYFYNFFKDKIPVPKIILYDKSKKAYNKSFMIYPKIQGDNLYSRWHLMSNPERKNIIRQLCKILRTINKSSFDEFASKFKINPSVDWQEKILTKIKYSLKKAEDKKILLPDILQAIKDFAEKNKEVLKEQKIALVYWDAHFDNILVKDNKIVGILDFERTELASIDFVLDIIRRMVNYPKKYMSKQQEEYAKKEDYARLLEWFKEFYPELFEFKNMDKRLELYSIEHDLDTLLGWPNSEETKEMIVKIVSE